MWEFVRAPFIRLLAVVVVGVAGLCGLSARAGAASCGSSPGQPVSGGPRTTSLTAVATTSPCNTWAVGSYQDSAFIERWNGQKWVIQQQALAGGTSNLLGAAATSPTNAWAVGWHRGVLLEHWNGRVWRIHRNEGVERGGGLEAVAATSSTNAWAVGNYSTSGKGFLTLVMHWDGHRWRVQHSPSEGGSSAFDELTSVAATSSRNAWAVGYSCTASCDSNPVESPLIERWNGTSWKIVPIANPGTPGSMNYLSTVTATSSNNAWAVGSYFDGTSLRGLIEHWNGHLWKVQPSPGDAYGAYPLSGVAATSKNNAWAISSYPTAGGVRALILHWNGTDWNVQRSPDRTSSKPVNNNQLVSVAASSSTNAWAVGSYSQGDVRSKALGLHWNGSAWQR